MPDRDGMDQDRPVAIVTGGAGGLGSAFCRALGSRGFRAVPVDIKGTERVVDVTDISACRDLASELQPVVWINNAGILGAGSAIDQPDEIVSSVLAVNLSGVINGTRAALGVMSEIGRGWILNVGSLAAWAPTPGLAVYCASKHAVRAYTTTVAMEMAGSGIRLCTICPDGIWTPMLEEVLDEKAAAMAFSGGRLLDADEVAKEGLALLFDTNRLTGSMPAGRAALAKLASLAPGLLAHLDQPLARRGQALQRKWRSRISSGTGRNGDPLSTPASLQRLYASKGLGLAEDRSLSPQAGRWPEVPSRQG